MLSQHCDSLFNLRVQQPKGAKGDHIDFPKSSPAVRMSLRGLTPFYSMTSASSQRIITLEHSSTPNFPKYRSRLFHRDSAQCSGAGNNFSQVFLHSPAISFRFFRIQVRWERWSFRHHICGVVDLKNDPTTSGLNLQDSPQAQHHAAQPLATEGLIFIQATWKTL